MESILIRFECYSDNRKQDDLFVLDDSEKLARYRLFCWIFYCDIKQKRCA